MALRPAKSCERKAAVAAKWLRRHHENDIWQRLHHDHQAGGMAQHAGEYTAGGSWRGRAPTPRGLLQASSASRHRKQKARRVGEAAR